MNEKGLLDWFVPVWFLRKLLLRGIPRIDTLNSGGVATVNAKGSIGSTTSNHVLKQVASMFETGRSYRVSFKVKQTTGSGNFQMGNGYQAHFNQSVTSEFVTYSFVANPTSWVNVHHEFLYHTLSYLM